MSYPPQASEMNGEAVARVEDLWFSQDALVIRAENRIFRVTKSILAARSPVFSDMAAFPQPSGTGDELFEGSPVVRLHDSAVAVEVFLRAIFDSSYFMPPPAPVELHALLAILRLSHKYDVQYLHLRALHHLSVAYGPMSVAEYRASDEKNHIIYPTPDGKTLAHLSVIAAATEVIALWLLPVAFYLASTSTPEDLRVTTALGAQEHHVQNCLSAQRELLRGTGSVWSFLSASSSTTALCTARGACEITRKRGLTYLFDNFSDGADLTPLDDWDDSEEGFGWLKISLCTSTKRGRIIQNASRSFGTGCRGYTAYPLGQSSRH
ncbi:hypothetical protein C8R43DRAFT_969138 [Mycena crocata]|nr:hypothetical protein C8R43DRAFT_969138 [Mycena crocata]